MKFKSLFLPVVAVGAATLLTATPEESHGYSLIGDELGVDQRDFRIFNNFLDSQANNNTEEHVRFPGYTGAVLAIWKASVEWGSELHGNGAGDPHQPGGLGSGLANFDPSFQGLATGVGSSTSNIHSALDADGGGTFAFAEGSPFGNGAWRIRYYENWTWSDGPNASTPAGQVDLQGIACHEYGHAVGLGHSATGAATMFGSTSGNDPSERSIHSDDRAGTQDIYGTVSGTKPSIDFAWVQSGVIMIEGENFTGSNNEVWFTQASAGGSGTPVKVTGASSTAGGTMISVNVPGNAGPGDILVKRNSSGNSSISNAYPIDPTVDSDVQPNITGFSPSTVDAVVVGTQPVVISGSNLGGTTDVLVDGQSLSVSNYTIDGGAQVTILDMPLVSNVGSIDIEVVNSFGSETSQITVAYPASPVLEATETSVIQASGIEITEGANFGDVHILYVSTDLIPTDFGSFQMDIGNGGATLFLIKVDAIQVKGWKQRFFGPLSGLTIGTMLHWQSAVAELANAYALPWNPTNVETITIIG